MVQQVSKLSFLFCSLFLSSFSAWSLESPFPSTVENISTPNAHMINQSNGRVFRSQNPRSPEEYQEILNAGITDFLIFKAPTAEEVVEELKYLKEELQVSEKNLHWIPFKWRDLNNFRESCEQTLQALRLLRDVSRSSDKKVLFHCTVGEDRTGTLAGLFRILNENANYQDIFKEEMCKWGYEHGNGNKPFFVYNAIRTSLTPFYLKMAYKIEQGFLSLDNLDSDQCAIDPGDFEEFTNNPNYQSSDYKCRVSSEYIPPAED